MLNIYNSNNHNGDNPNGLPDSKVGSKVNFIKYEDPTQEFTSKELKWSFWYVRHKAKLYKMLVISLLLVDAIFLGFSVWKWGEYLLGYASHQQLERSLAASINYTGLHAHFGAQPIQIINTQVFASSKNKYDVVAELVNPNSRFLVSFDYYFIINGIKTERQKNFLLPGESRFAAQLGIDNENNGSPTIVLENIKYKRISNHQIKDIASWQAYWINFTVSDFVFSKSLAQEGDNVDALQFKLTNASPYNYVAPNFYIALLQNNQMVGILPLHLDRINSLETKNIDLRSFAPNLNITEIAVYPIINIYDETVYTY